MLRLVSLNLNGIRSAAAKGWLPWAESIGADCMGVQELRAVQADLAGRFESVAGLKGHFHCAEKKGYSGVGLYARDEPSDVLTGIGDADLDAEGRWVEVRFDRLHGRAALGGASRLSFVSCYFPSGSSGELRQAAKFRFLALMTERLQQLRAEREFVLLGDVNIAHREIDLKNWRGNRTHSGFLPEERAWLSHALDGLGLVDVFRRLNPHPEQYTWWSQRGQARAKNVGWRIDYQLATPAVAMRARSEHIYLAERFSDHAPVVIDYDFAV